MASAGFGQIVARGVAAILPLVAAVVCCGVVMATAEAAIKFKRSGDATLGGADALAGLREACEVADDHIWVDVEGRGECIAIHATSGFATAEQVVLYFEGDVPSDFARRPARLRQHLDAMRRLLKSKAQTYKLPFALVARPGTFGSTGNHADRRMLREHLVMAAVVRGLIERNGYSAVTLAGQSGGATLVAAMLTRGMEGVKCATPASGGYDLSAMLDWHARRQGVSSLHREHPASIAGDLNVMDRLDGVVVDPERRIFVIGDPADRVTPFAQQKRFAEQMARRGHHAVMLSAKGTGADRHGLTVASLTAAGLCARGANEQAIRSVMPR
jgi:hypothetical protein